MGCGGLKASRKLTELESLGDITLYEMVVGLLLGMFTGTLAGAALEADDC